MQSSYLSRELARACKPFTYMTYNSQILLMYMPGCSCWGSGAAGATMESKSSVTVSYRPLLLCISLKSFLKLVFHPVRFSTARSVLQRRPTRLPLAMAPRAATPEHARQSRASCRRKESVSRGTPTILQARRSQFEGRGRRSPGCHSSTPSHHRDGTRLAACGCSRRMAQ